MIPPKCFRLESSGYGRAQVGRNFVVREDAIRRVRSTESLRVMVKHMFVPQERNIVHRAYHFK